MKEGRKKLEESLRRLGIDESRTRSKNLINFGVDFLIAEKTKVKSELKRFDNEFAEMFNRQPNRIEKEIMRPLYMYYKNLKNVLDTKHKGGYVSKNQQKESDTGLNNNYVQNNKKIDSVNSQLKQDIGNQRSGSIDDNNSKKTANNNNNNNNVYSFNQIYSKNETPVIQESTKTSSNTSQKEKSGHSISTLIGNNNNSFSHNKELKNNDKKHTDNSDKDTDFLLLLEAKDSDKRSNSHSYKDKKFTKIELVQMEKEFDVLKKGQIELKQKLHDYQKEFYDIHNRRVKFYRDIIGVEKEYQSYKDNKIRMRDIQQILLANKK